MTPFDVLECFDWVLGEEEIAIDYIREGKHWRIAQKAVSRMNKILRDETIARKFQTIDDAIQHLCLTYVRSSKFEKFGVNPSACFSEDTFRKWREGLLFGENHGKLPRR